MKKIVIHEKQNSNPIVIFDDDQSNLLVYTKEVIKIMESSKICILETSSGNVVLRPSNIFAIIVTNHDVNLESKKTIINNEDIIKD